MFYDFSYLLVNRLSNALYEILMNAKDLIS